MDLMDGVDSAVDRLTAEGLTRAEIAAVIGCSWKTVWRRQKLMGIFEPERRPIDTDRATALLARGYRMAEIAQILGHDYTHLRRALRVAGLPPLQTPVNDAERWQMARMYRGGQSMRAIGRALGRHEQTVKAQLTAAGVQTGPWTPPAEHPWRQ